jgi:hypothetical protein
LLRVLLLWLSAVSAYSAKSIMLFLKATSVDGLFHFKLCARMSLIDPTATSAVADGPVLDASFERPPCRVGIETCSTAQRVRTSRAGRCHPVKTASYVVIDVDQDIV